MKVKAMTLLMTLMLTKTACADVPPEQQPEVAHLLQVVKNSRCKVNRNGSLHQGEEVTSHIQKKYAYFRDKIKTTEDFIRYSASRSTLSGKYYTVHCEGQEPIRTRDWLLQELKEYREDNHL